MSNPGSRVKPVYSMLIHDDGTPYFSVTGKIDIQDQIQSHALSCDINYLLERFSNGDVDALNRANTYYGDFVGAPSSFVEVLQSMTQARQYFDHLPLKLREQFDFDFNRFYASLDRPETIKIVNDYYAPPAAPDPGQGGEPLES